MLLNLKNKIKGFSEFLVSFSGGMDSTVLLHQLIQIKNLYNLNIKIRAMHIHHGLSIFADSWLKHCHQQCKNWNVPFIFKHINIKNNNIGIEAYARNIRYEILFKNLNKKEILLTGHHINDQCETFFLALKRGSGPYGLSSMPDIRYINNKILLRPLINQSFNKIIYWAKYYNLKWVEDNTNQNLKLERNFLRKEVLPIIYNRWPYFSNAVYRSASICREQEKLIDDLLSDDLKKIIKKDGSFITDTLKKMNNNKRNALLRRWIILIIKIVPSYKILKIIWKELINSRIDRSPILKIGNYEIRRYKNTIHLVVISSCLKNIIIEWKNPFKKILLPQNIGCLILNYKHGKEIRKPNINEKITIRFNCNLEYIKILERNKIFKIKKIWKEFFIPVWKRNKIPMLFYNEKLISFIGLFITQNGYCEKNRGWKIFLKKNNYI